MVSEIFKKLAELGLNKTAYADCPHCGYKNSLAITKTTERVLFFCFAGCQQDVLWRSLKELTPALLPPDTPKPYPYGPATSYIKFLWERSLPAAGSLVETYLRSRGIFCPLPPSLRFLPNHLHKPTETTWPVMLAAVCNVKGELRGVHRTFLAADGSAKASVMPPRMTLGPIGGHTCHLAEAGKELVVAEGIETALSVQLTIGLPAWAALNAGGMVRMNLPPLPLASFVIVAADADPPGLRAAKAAALRWIGEGRRAEVIVPSRPGADFNDLLREASL
jgi:putative DNA primase/helicase